ncbi:ANTAR domain-containing protein [Aeromicrobium sp.]|uniref:ANTAR domain-containing protein n=1 Tax=Aeromicrobium sp. TaxID=1871063 RepID=UPI001989A2CE|nr:ANTAR domain-containing protein [Aeromicrobium sp.]MBC7630335.1 ANTAR domain-containing protein [Aeromicrobium sp.]
MLVDDPSTSGGLDTTRTSRLGRTEMCQTSVDVIIQAQAALMTEHDVTSETALGLLVWAATDGGVTVLEVALTICEAAPDEHLHLGGAVLCATA